MLKELKHPSTLPPGNAFASVPFHFWVIPACHPEIMTLAPIKLPDKGRQTLWTRGIPVHRFCQTCIYILGSKEGTDSRSRRFGRRLAIRRCLGLIFLNVGGNRIPFRSSER